MVVKIFKSNRRSAPLSKAKRARGFTLIETMLSIGLVSAATMATVSFGSKVWMGLKVSQAGAVAEQMNGQVLSRFAITPNFSSLPDTPASTWISDLPMSGGNVQGPWGAVQLQAATVNTASDSWALTFNAVPRGDCVNMLISMSPKYYASGANGVLSKAAPGKSIDPTEADQLCSAGVNSVSLVYPPSTSITKASVSPAYAAAPASTLAAWAGPTGSASAPVAAASGAAAAPVLIVDSGSGNGSASGSSGGDGTITKDVSGVAPMVPVVDQKDIKPAAIQQNNY